VYISRDVIFDEEVFPFSKLHPNAGARLGSEILLHPSNLLNPSSGNESVGCSLTNDVNTNIFIARNNDVQDQIDPMELGASSQDDFWAYPP
jgi:hypothetical protein